MLVDINHSRKRPLRHCVPNVNFRFHRVNIMRLFLLCAILSLCNSEEVGDLKDEYFVREDLKRGDEMFCAKLPAPNIKSVEIVHNPHKPLKTNSEMKQNGEGFCVIMDDIVSFKAKDNEYMLILKFLNSAGVQKETRITIKLQQVNRYSPKFEPNSATIAIPEEIEGGNGTILTLNVTDDDYRDRLSTSIANLQYFDQLFKLEQVNQRLSHTAHLINFNKLDYETKTYYRIEIVAMDNVDKKIEFGGQHKETAIIHINVVDVDDQPPNFQKECGVLRIEEHSKRDVTKVHAVDGDHGVNNPIGYMLPDAIAEEFFIITKQAEGDAILAVVGNIDREDDRFIMNPLITFKIQADEYYDAGLENMVEERRVFSICNVVIEDINDNAPEFSKNEYRADVKENTQVGIPVTFPENILPSVKDIDEGENATFELLLGNNNDTFTVTPSEGISNVTFLLRVNNVTALDFERSDLQEPKHLQLQIVAKEKTTHDPKTSTATIRVYLEDENDNFPQFVSPEKTSVSENASMGQSVAIIKAEDIDSGWFGSPGIRYNLMTSYISNSFSLDSITGHLTISTNQHGLDRETTEIHYLTIEARDNNGTGNRNTTQLQVELLDANDNPPIFQFSSYRSQLMENSVNFIEELHLHATDRDKEGTPNSEVRYKIADGDKKKQFHIDNENGTLTPAKPLDFEDSEGPPVDEPCISVCTRTFELIIVAYDLGEPQMSSSVLVYITLLDVNDNTPVFSKKYIEATINETSPQGTIVATVHADDADISPIYKNISYSIIGGGEGNFVIDRDNGRITVARNADLDVSYNVTRKKRQLLIEASDAMMKSSSCDILVNINDINDKKPKFQNIDTSEKYEVLENVKDVLIGKFPADDPDETALLYYLINYDESVALKPDLFSRVDESYYNFTNIFNITDEGEVWVINPADREKMKQIDLLLNVVDLNAEVNIPQEDTLRIRVTILDVNDNDPEFRDVPPSGYVGRVSENVKDVTLLNIFAIDIDENNTITYTIEGDAKIHKHFHLNSESGELRVISSFDYEEDQWINFTAVATDSGVPPRNASIGVFIEIIDENDNTPQFEGEPYHKSIYEHVPIGTSVIQLNASDADSGDYGLVYFRIPKLDQDDDYFSIDTKTGIIRVNGDLDREEQEIFKINVQAYDNPMDTKNQRINTTKVMITLLDINDHAPIIDKVDDCFSIPETTAVNSTITRITATDKDKENTPNSEIEYFIEDDGFFQIALDGTLYVSASVKNLHQKIKVIIMAKDKGSPPLNSTETFCIDVYDVNTHKPKFIRPPPGETAVVVVDEKTEKRKEVYTVEAMDNDNNKETNGRVTYRLLGDEFQDNTGHFTIHPDVGTVRVNAQLDKGITEEYMILIEACDNGEPKLCADHANLLIYIRSEKDTKPHFEEPTGEASFTEHSVPGLEKYVIPEATLIEQYVNDTSVPICYYIVGGDEKFFNLEKDTRILTLAKEVDREVTPFYSIIIQADTDCLNPPFKLNKITSPQPDIITIKVRILDINDNAPVFVKKQFTGGINTKDKAGKNILTLLATDADEGENAVITYLIVGEIKVNKGEGLDMISVYFNLNETTGILSLAFQPSANTKGHFSFTAMAKDIGDLSDTAEVLVYLMRNDQQVRLIIAKGVNEITKEDISGLQTIMMEATGYIVNVDDISSYSGSDERYKRFTEVWIHCVEPSTNEVVESEKAIRAIDQHYKEIVDKIDPSIGMIGAEKYVEEQEQSSWDKHGEHLLIGIIGMLSLFLFLALIVYFIRISSYRRLLKAATAKAFGPGDSAAKDFNKNMVPNTNLHAIQGSNPIWNQEDEIVKRFCNEETISENGSTDSLDINVIEPTVIEDGCKSNPLFSNEDEIASLKNREDSIKLIPESPSVFGEDNKQQQPMDLGSRLSVLHSIDSEWRRRLTNGSITPLKSQENFTFGTSKLGETDDV